jgi:hypothetical protein
VPRRGWRHVASRRLPAEWFRWSDGRVMSSESVDNMKRVMRKSDLRLTGETLRGRFVRLRATIERAVRESRVRE